MDNVLLMLLSNRNARNVAQMLKRIGYRKITIEECDGKSPLEIAGLLEPLDNDLMISLADDIAVAAGFKPRKKK